MENIKQALKDHAQYARECAKSERTRVEGLKLDIEFFRSKAEAHESMAAEYERLANTYPDVQTSDENSSKMSSKMSFFL